MATSFKARVNKLKSTRVSVSQKSEKPAQQTPLSSSLEEETLKAWINSTSSLNNAISRIESDVSSVKSDRDRVIKLEVELEKLMQLIANKEYFKNIFMEMLESMEPEELKEEKEEKEEEWKNYIDNELNNLRSILNTTHSSISKSIEEINQNNSKKLNFLEEQINLNKNVNLKEEIDKKIVMYCDDYQEKIDKLKEATDERLDNYCNNYQEEIHKLKEATNKMLHTYRDEQHKNICELKTQYEKDSSESKVVIEGLNSKLADLHTNASEFKQGLAWTSSQLNALKEDYTTSMVTIQKNSKNDIESLETTFKNKQKKINELIEENSNNLEKIKKENINIKNNVETIEKITKETSTIFVTKVADLVEYTKKLDGRISRCENYSKDLGVSIGGVKELFDGEKASLSKIISNLKDDFVDLHERCDNTLSTLYRNDTQHIIDKYVFELSQLNVLFESSKTMQRENNYFKCIGNLSNRLDKIEQKIN